MMALANLPRGWRLADLLAGFADVGPNADRRVDALTSDSQAVVPGTLFLACPGAESHGMDQAEGARTRGAVAILAEPDARWDNPALVAASGRLGLPVIEMPGLTERLGALADRFYGAETGRLELVGVAGAAGTSSTAYLMAQALATQVRSAFVGAVGVGFPDASDQGDPGSLVPRPADTLALYQTLARLSAQGAHAVALAISPLALHQGQATALHLNQVVLTNFDGATHQDRKAVAALMGRPGLGWAVVNADDPAIADIAAMPHAGTHLALYGRGARPPSGRNPDLWVGLTDLTPLPRGLRLEVVTISGGGPDRAEVEVPLLGACNAANVLAVLAVLRARGLSLAAATHALTRVTAVPGRLEGFGGGEAPLAVVDCARTPAALARALAQLRPHCRGRLILVFGCDGATDTQLRHRMGEVAEAGSDLVILTDDNPGAADADAILDGVRAGMTRPEQARVQRQRGLAIRIALTLAGRDDCVLIAGKGHETIQDMGDLKVRFSDRAQAVQALSEWTGARR